jgi:hypothetical protein
VPWPRPRDASSSAPETLASKPSVQTPAQKIDPNAVKALRDMSAFLQSLSTFKLESEASLDVVTNDGQKVQLDGVAQYKVRKSNAFAIDIVSDSWNRQYIYNGREFTLYAPKLGFYATVPAPATNQATIAMIGTSSASRVPLDDLFRWSSADGARLTPRIRLPGRHGHLEGVKTNHYAFSRGQDRLADLDPAGRPAPAAQAGHRGSEGPCRFPPMRRG